MDTCNNESEFKHIPFRIYSTDEGPFVQKLVKPSTNDGRPKLLQNLIQEIYPDICDKGNFFVMLYNSILNPSSMKCFVNIVSDS